MPYQRPLLKDLITQTQADVISTAGNLLPLNILTLLATDQAGLANLHHGHIDRVALECTPWSSIDTLESWAALRGVTREPAAAASGVATFSGINGISISSGLTVTRQDGRVYTITSGATVSGGYATVSIADTTPGSAGNCISGTPLTLNSAPDGVNAAGVSGVVAGGAEAQSDDSLRTEMLAVYAAPPQGGAMADYVEWAMQVPGVTRAWCAPLGGGDGTVYVYTMWDVAEVAHGGFPQGSDGVAAAAPSGTVATGDQLAVANHIFPLRPVTAVVTSKAPTAYPVNFRITDVYPATAEMQAAIGTSLTAVFARSAAPTGTTWPVAMAGVPNGTMYMNAFTSALDVIPGLQRYTLVTPNAAITAPTGAIPTLGTMTWV